MLQVCDMRKLIIIMIVFVFALIALATFNDFIPVNDTVSECNFDVTHFNDDNRKIKVIPGFGNVEASIREFSPPYPGIFSTYNGSLYLTTDLYSRRYQSLSDILLGKFDICYHINDNTQISTKTDIYFECDDLIRGYYDDYSGGFIPPDDVSYHWITEHESDFSGIASKGTTLVRLHTVNNTLIVEKINQTKISKYYIDLTSLPITHFNQYSYAVNFWKILFIGSHIALYNYSRDTFIIIDHSKYIILRLNQILTQLLNVSTEWELVNAGICVDFNYIYVVLSNKHDYIANGILAAIQIDKNNSLRINYALSFNDCPQASDMESVDNCLVLCFSSPQAIIIEISPPE